MSKLQYGKLEKDTFISITSNNVKEYVSVIIPVYKDAEGLADTLISLINQSFPKTMYEIIVVNDSGDEEIKNVCCRFNVKMVEIIPNAGSYYARNRAIEISNGEYIAFVDADILVPYNWLKNGYRLLNKYDYIAGDVKIDENKVKSIAHYYELYNSFKVGDYIEKYHFGPTANLFVRRDVFLKIGGFDERLQSSGDLEFGDRVFSTLGLKQFHANNLICIHPPRDFNMLKNKFKRIAKGHVDLNTLYPNRFSFHKKSNIKSNIIDNNKKSIAIDMSKDVRVIFVGVYLKMYKLFWKIIYTHLNHSIETKDFKYNISVIDFNDEQGNSK